MDLDEQIAASAAEAKRNCNLCMGRAHLRNVDIERSSARKAVSGLIQLFNEKFNLLRRKDAAAGEIKKAIESKRLCMTVLQQCDKCDKEVDLIKREMGKAGL